MTDRDSHPSIWFSTDNHASPRTKAIARAEVLITCPACDGKGEIEVYDKPRSGDPHAPPEWHFEPCDAKCDAGELMITIQDDDGTWQVINLPSCLFGGFGKTPLDAAKTVTRL